jgi:hypothetical protein
MSFGQQWKEKYLGARTNITFCARMAKLADGQPRQAALDARYEKYTLK